MAGALAHRLAAHDLRHRVEPGVRVEGDARIPERAPDQLVAFVAGGGEKGAVELDAAVIAQPQNGDRQRTGVEGFGESFLRDFQRLLRQFALGHFEFELGVARLERAGAFIHEAVEVFELVPRLAGHEPFLGERVRELEDFDAVERFLEDYQPVGLAQLGDNLLPRVIGIRRANDDLDRGVDCPNPRDRFHAIPARRHPHIHESHRVRPPFSDRAHDHVQPFLALKSRVELELGLHFNDRRFRPEKLRHHIIQRAAGGHRRAEDFAEIRVDFRVVVNDEDAVVIGDDGRGIHG